MDPLAVLAVAKGSYEAIKAGIALGKELQGMAKDLGSLFDSVAHITRIAADPKGSFTSGKSAQQIAMEAYAAKAEADAMMEDLKNHFIGEFGIAAWDQVVSATTQIKKDMKAAALQEQREHEEMMNTFATGMLFVLIAVFGISIIVSILYIIFGR